MARYIDAELLKKNIRVNLMPNVDIDGTVTVENAERYFLNLIEKTTTADVEEVVRCKDCIYFKEKRLGEFDTAVGICQIEAMWCEEPIEVLSVSFCSGGERVK